MNGVLTVMVPVAPRQASGAVAPQMTPLTGGRGGSACSPLRRWMWRRPLWTKRARCRKVKGSRIGGAACASRKSLPGRAAQNRHRLKASRRRLRRGSRRAWSSC